MLHKQIKPEGIKQEICLLKQINGGCGKSAHTSLYQQLDGLLEKVKPLLPLEKEWTINLLSKDTLDGVGILVLY